MATRRNCNHFASDLCERLTGSPAPEWVSRRAWVDEKAKFLLPKGFTAPTATAVTAQAAGEPRAADDRYANIIAMGMAEMSRQDASGTERDHDHADKLPFVPRKAPIFEGFVI